MKKLFYMLTVLFVVGASPGQADTVAKMLGDSGLSAEDIEIMTGQATSLYTSSSRSVGAQAEWNNDDSGTFGSVEILAIKENCVTLGHVFTTKKKSRPQQVQVRRCKAADGSWKLN